MTPAEEARLREAAEVGRKLGASEACVLAAVAVDEIDRLNRWATEVIGVAEEMRAEFRALRGFLNEPNTSALTKAHIEKFAAAFIVVLRENGYTVTKTGHG